MMERLDFVAGADGQINFSEFLAANLDLTKLMTEDKLMAIFQMYDTRNSGCITTEDMQAAFSKQGY